MKYMMVIRGKEDDASPPQALFDAIDGYIADNMKSGVLVDTGGLAPTKEGFRVRSSGGKLKVTDGPFTEAKEVIGGYAVVKAESDAEARRMATEFMELHRLHWREWDGEVEVRQIVGGPDVG